MAGHAVTDVLVVGAGPAGMAAALEAAEAGCQVTVLDSAPAPGGQYHRQPPASFHQSPPPVVRRVLDHPSIRLEHETTVWGAEPLSPSGARLHALRSDDAPAGWSAPAVVLATGAHDRPLPFPGWTLPGVFTAGGAQALAKGQHVLPGRRVAVAGTGPFLLPVAAQLARSGATVVGVFEASSGLGWGRRLPAVLRRSGKVAEAARYARVLARHRVPLRQRHAVVRAHGDHAVEAVTVARLRPDWTPVAGSERRYEVDAVCIGFGFVPAVELAAALGCALGVDPHGASVVSVTDTVRTSVAGVYAAGEATGIGGVDVAAAEGVVAGITAAEQLGRAVDQRRLGRALRSLRASAPFTAALDAVYAVRPGWQRWLDDDTLVCRCEEVTAGRVRGALGEQVAADLRSVKLHTRAGMGMCQGRMCGHAVAGLVTTATGEPPDPAAFAHRPLGVPVPLSTLAELAPEAGKEATDAR